MKNMTVHHIVTAALVGAIYAVLSIFGSFFGIIGMLLAVPLAGIAQIFMKKWALSK